MLSIGGQFGPVLLSQVSKNDDEEHCFLKEFGIIQNTKYFLLHCFDNCFSLFGVLGDNLVLCVTASDANKQIAKFGPQMGYVTFVCLGISIICLSLHIFASFVTSELQNLSGKNLLSLCFALLGGYISFIAGNITIIFNKF